VAPALRDRGRVPLATMVRGAWLALGGPACVSESIDIDAAQRVLSLLAEHSAGADVADWPAFAAALEGLEPPSEAKWRNETPLAHADFLAWTDKPTAVPGPVNLGEIIAGLRGKLPEDAVICNGAGNFSVWVHRYARYRRYGSELAPISGSMGYGVPAAIGMKRPGGTSPRVGECQRRSASAPSNGFGSG